MRRFALVAALACVLTAPILTAQPQEPAKRAAYIPPVKGIATIEVIQSPSKRVGQEMVTVLKIRNTSKGSINLLKLDEYWYDKSMKIVSGAPSYAHRKAPIQPGEIVEITLRSPVRPGMSRNQVMFTHAYGDAKATPVKVFK
ncbi:MAG: hypothetical protein M3468_05905 [Acidobacteriota bacterium]|nr:hypothetical protein [Acidobacteriota bacterium]MDQ3487255.1 hypothetical protein [Acidobacteriota bacterium]